MGSWRIDILYTGMIDSYGTNPPYRDWRTDQSARGSQRYPMGGQQSCADHCRVPYCGLQCDRPGLDYFSLKNSVERKGKKI